MRITINDVRRAGYCVRGARRFCEDRGVDFRKFVKEGLPVEDVEAVDDELVRRVVAQVRKNGGGNGSQ